MACKVSDGIWGSGSTCCRPVSRSSGKERDSETGLDYFGARYYGSNMGRFLSPDWSETLESVPYADLGDPQTLNLYGYVRNNPPSTADADGHCTVPIVCPVLTGLAVAGETAAATIGTGLITAGGLLVLGYAMLEGHAIEGGGSTYGIGADGGTTAYLNRTESNAQNAQQQSPSQTGNESTPAQPPEGDGKETTRAARREAMRQEGIPTSQQPTSQVSTKAGRQYTYEVPKPGGGTQTKIVTNQLKDRNHGPHVEAGSPKSNRQTDPSGRQRHSNKKTKVNVETRD